MTVVWSAVAALAGALIGISFGLLQTKATQRNKALEQTGKLNSGFGVMPGSMRRVAYLVIALALVQLVCPLLFTNHCEWWVSTGVVGGYGAMLYNQLRRRLAHTH
ncbi:MAG TPA: hypothetical protein VHI52_19935 [Verrucomicrobiae bacterium]|nr:hypothetical protein [Verrucomicrobiae bacterium]